MTVIRTAALSAASFLALAAAADAGEIKGRVSASGGVVSLDGAIVTVLETGRKVATGRDGSFRVAGLDAGTYTLSVSYLGADTVETTATLSSDDDTATVDINLGDDVAVVDNILVVGQRGALAAALNQQRASDNLITVLSSDAIGSLPDQNVAEAARRAVGVQVLNDQGEGRFVSIRGAAPGLNSVTINGVRVPSPEGGTRAVALDVIDSDILDSITITKSLRPDMDADAIGGSIEIKSLSAFDYDGVYLRAKLGGNYTDQVDEFGEEASVAAANTFMDGRLGVAGSLSYRRRDFGSENIEVDGGEYFGGASGNDVPAELELRDYQIERERFSAALNLDYQMTDSYRVYLRTLFSDFSDQEFRTRIEYKLGEFDDSVVVRPNAASVAGIEIDRDLKDRLETQQIFSLVGGGEYARDALTLEWSAAYSHAEEEEPNRLDTDFRASADTDPIFDGDEPATAGQFGVVLTDPELPRLSLAQPASAAAFSNPDLFALNGAEVVNGISEDDEFAVTFDAQYDTDILSAPGFVKAGFKGRFREKSVDVEVDVFDGDETTTLAGFATALDYELDSFGPGINPGGLRSLFANRTTEFEFNDFDSAIASTVEDYDATEDIIAGYVMASADFDDLRVVAGVRVEATDFEADATQVVELEEGGGAPLDVFPQFLIGSTADIDPTTGAALDDVVLAGPTSADQSYTDVLPSINLRFEAANDVILRAAYYASIVRPNISDAAPIAELAIDEDDEREAAVGNPDLDRQQAHNIDASFEWYFAPESAFSAGVFYKSVENFIAVRAFEDITFNGLVFDELVQAVNLDDAEILGFEIGYQQTFSMLPAPFDGLLLSANYTFVDSEATVTNADGSSRRIALPEQSEQIGNLIVGYDKGRFDLRAALSYRDEYIDVVDGAGEGIDRVVLDQLQLDVQGAVRITDQFSAYFKGTNLNDEPFQAVSRFGDRDRLNQFEEYGWAVQFGLQYKF